MKNAYVVALRSNVMLRVCAILLTLFALPGLGVAQTITITGTPFFNFGNQPVNTASAPRATFFEATGLSGPVTIVAPAGFQVRVGTGAFVQSTSVAPAPDGTIGNTQVDIRFLPTSSTAYSDEVTFNSPGADQQTVFVGGRGTTPPPSIATSTAGPLSFGSVQEGDDSTPQTFTVSGNNLTGPVTVAAPADFEVSLSATTGFGTSVNLTGNGGTLAATTVYVRFSPNSAIGPVTRNVQVSTPNGAQTISTNVQVTGNGTAAPTEPVITASPTTLNFGTVTNSGSGGSQFFTVRGTRLQGDLTLTPTANIQIRNAAGGNFTSGPLVLPRDPSTGFVANTTIEVRLVSVIAQGPFNGDINITSPGAVPVQIDVVANNPSGAVSDVSLTNSVFTEFSTSPNVPSAAQSYNVQGNNLLNPITITAPPFFQIATSNNPADPNYFPGNTTGNTIVLPLQGNNVPLTTIYVRYYPPASQTNSGTFIENSSPPAPGPQRVSVIGSSEPLIQLLDVFTPVVNAIKGSASPAQTLRVRGLRLSSPVTIRVPNDATSPLNPSGTPQFKISTDNITFGYEVTMAPSGSPGTINNQPLYVRYEPTRVGSARADLQFSSPDFFGGSEFLVPNGRLEGNAIDREPLIQANARLVRSADGRSVTITFIDAAGNPLSSDLAVNEANGFGENRLIIGSAVNTVLDRNSFPEDATEYSPGSTDANNAYIFGTGTNYPQGSDNYVVFAGSSVSVTISGLRPEINYYFFGFEYNNDQVGGAENFKVPNEPVQVVQPLPVEMVAFTGKLRNDKVVLEWATAQEKNNRGFEVQRSSNSREFTTIGFKAGNGTTASRSEYSLVDDRPLKGTSYYRLKQIDNDGVSVFSRIITVVNGRGGELSVFPNPVDDVLNIRLADVTSETVVTVTDLLGRTVYSGKLNNDGTLDMRSLKPGQYMVIVTNGTQKVAKKVVKR